MIEPRVSMEPLFSSDHICDGVFTTILGTPRYTVGYRNGKFWGNRREGGTSIGLQNRELAMVISKYKLDVLVPEYYESIKGQPEGEH